MNKTRVTRNEVFEWFKLENTGIDPLILEKVFRETSDSEIAKTYGLKILSPGVFYR